MADDHIGPPDVCLDPLGSPYTPLLAPRPNQITCVFDSNHIEFSFENEKELRDTES